MAEIPIGKWQLLMIWKKVEVAFVVEFCDTIP